MTKAKAKTTIAPVKSNNDINHTNYLVGVTEPILKGLSLYCATELMKQPQFTTQVSETSIVNLAEFYFRFMTNQVKFDVPVAPVEEPKFG